ncbi:MAG TPA: TonB-dependent receptor [Rhodanobacteraceae bacterium]|nr:TonB-dependent receptor [Rhodanobacteraceae bacterium]
MRLNRNELSKAVKAALSISAVAAMCAAGSAFAQNAGDQSDQTPQTLQTITVTGSHIRQSELSTAQPVVSVTQADIQKQGFTTVADILQNLTVSGTPAISRQAVLSSGESVGGYYIDIHNLGAERTLILLNGKRLGVTEDGIADLQQIPVSAIERIEVLKDGASAIYGSDAIGGVVNIITRNRFTGAEVSAYVGQYDENSDGTAQTYGMTIGARGDKGSVMLTAEYGKQEPVWTRDRWFSKYPNGPYHPKDGWTLVSQWGLFFNYNYFTYAPYTPGLCSSAYCTPNHDGSAFNPYDPNSYHPTDFAAGSTDRTNTNLDYMLQTALEHKSLFTSATWDFNDHLHFQSDILYNHRDTFVHLAGYPFNPGFSLPGEPLGPSTSIALSPDSYFNPIGSGPLSDGEGQTIYFYRRGWEMPRVSNNVLNTYRIGGTLSGDFNIGDHNWNWDVGGYSNINDALVTSSGNLSLVAAKNALGPSWFNPATQRVECGSAANPIPYGGIPGACIPWNPLYPNGTVGEGSLTGHPDLQRYLAPIYHDTGRVQSTEYSANITGPLFTLPAGDLALAFGVEYRQEKGNFEPDASRQGALSTDLSTGPTGGEYTVKSEYLEVSAPLLKDVPFFHSLSLDAAIRHSKYSTFGSTTNDKFSLTWRPIEDLLLGGTIAHGFRAPQIADLFGGLSGTFDSYVDPCDLRNSAGSNPEVAARCTSGFGGQPGVPAGFQQLGQGNTPCASFPCQTNVAFLAGANPNLQPEKALSRTAQIVYSPSWIPESWGRLDVSVDYFDIMVTNAISGDTVSAILNDCYVLGIASRCSSLLFKRDPTTGVVTYALRGGRNAGALHTKGYDLGVNYMFPHTPIGQFRLAFAGTYWSAQESKADNAPDTPFVSFNGLDANFRYRANLNLDWSLGPWGATWTTRYYSGFREDCSYDKVNGGPECQLPDHISNGSLTPQRQLGSTTFNDLQVRYLIKPINATISVGANNVFDKFGPVIYGNARTVITPYYAGFDIGRFYYVRYLQKF